MWFEIFPSAIVTFGVLSAPYFVMWTFHRVILGNAYRRNTDEQFDRVMYQRDYRLTGNPYIMNGLDEICDDE